MYEELYEAWKKEKADVEIQALSRDFYLRLSGYMKRIREESRLLDEKTIKARLMQQELKNATKMVNDLFQLRFGKTLKKVFSENILIRKSLTVEEEKLYEDFLLLVESCQDLLKSVIRGKIDSYEKKEGAGKLLVKFTQKVPAIVGSDIKTYGPFKAEDVVNLPVENARILIKKGVAVEVESK
jgi:DNA replication factor GINS